MSAPAPDMSEQYEVEERYVTIHLLQYGRHPTIDSDSKVPSISPQSLAIQSLNTIMSRKYEAYLRMAGVPFIPVDTNDEHTSPGGNLPVLVVDLQETASGVRPCIEWLQANGFILDGDAEMNDATKAEQIAFMSLVEDRLHLFQLYNWFADAENYGAWTANAIAQKRRFPLNWWVPRKYKAEVLNKLELAGLMKLPADEVYRLASDIYKNLSNMLGDKSFFFGDHPSTLDAIVFGFLMTQENAKVPNPQLQKLIRSHRNLVDFLNRVLDIYFDELPGKKPKLNYRPLQDLYEKKEIELSKETKEAREFRSTSTQLILLGLVAVTIYTVAYNEWGQRMWEHITSEEDLDAGFAVI